MHLLNIVAAKDFVNNAKEVAADIRNRVNLLMSKCTAVSLERLGFYLSNLQKIIGELEIDL